MTKLILSIVLDDERIGVSMEDIFAGEEAAEAELQKPYVPYSHFDGQEPI